MDTEFFQSGAPCEHDCTVMSHGNTYVVAVSYRALQLLHEAVAQEIAERGWADSWEYALRDALAKHDVG